ncbi:MAG: putative RNA-binding protein (virulence factor B family) [Myxococcota bacterium]|jgi:predicted RNA-binding protein (virulence factor B family)
MMDKRFKAIQSALVRPRYIGTTGESLRRRWPRTAMGGLRSGEAMYEIGQYNTLRVLRASTRGLLLGTEDHHVLLPPREVPENAGAGDELEVFVYTDSDDRPVATTLRPLATVGQFACLRVVDTNEHGAFLDWGLSKDLFAPSALQHRPMDRGDWVVVAVSLHRRTQRVVASSTLAGNFDDDVSKLAPGDPVSLLVYGFTGLGVQVVVQDSHAGLIFKTGLARRLRLGEELEGFIANVRDDNRLDISLQRVGREGTEDAEKIILNALDAGSGTLELHDKSPPAAIRAALGLSKKAFKRAVGSLYRSRVIRLTDEGIHKVDPTP